MNNTGVCPQCDSLITFCDCPVVPTARAATQSQEAARSTAERVDRRFCNDPGAVPGQPRTVPEPREGARPKPHSLKQNVKPPPVQKTAIATPPTESLSQNPYLDVLGTTANGCAIVVKSYLGGGRIKCHCGFTLFDLLLLAPRGFWLGIGCECRGRINRDMAVDSIIRLAQLRGAYQSPIGIEKSGERS